MYDPGELMLPCGALLLMGLALRMSLRLLYGARGPAPDDVLYLLTSILSWALLLVPSAMLIVLGANWLALILGFFVAEAIVESLVAKRAAQREGVWRLLLDSIAAKQLDAATLEIHSPRFSGVVGRWFRRLGADLEQGVPWRQALVQNRRALPREALAYAAITAGHAIDAQDIQRLDDDRDAVYAEVKQQIAQRLAYLSVIGFMMLAVLTFVMIKIIPAFQEIFEDFDLDLPAVTLALLAASDALGRTIGVIVAGILLWTAVGVMIVGFAYLCDIPILQPVVDRLTISRHRAQVMRLLAAAIARGRTISETLDVLTSSWGPYPSAMMRRKLLKASRYVDGGAEWQTALTQARVISRSEAAVLRTAQDVGNLPWTLRMLAARRLRVMAFRWGVWQHVVFTVMMLGIGLFVLWFAVAMIVPLSDLVVRLSV